MNVETLQEHINSSLPKAFRILMAGLFVVIITGVLLSPPDAVHGLNHDYHAVWQQRGSVQKSTPLQEVFVYYTGLLPNISFGSCLIQKYNSSFGPDRVFSALTIIRTWRLLL